MKKQVLECTLCHIESDLNDVNLFSVKDILDKIDIDCFVSPLNAGLNKWDNEPNSWKDNWLEITREDGFVAHICPQCKNYITTAVTYGLLRVSSD